MDPIVSHFNSIQMLISCLLMFILLLPYNLRLSLLVVTMRQLYYLEAETSFLSKYVLDVNILYFTYFILYITFVGVENFFVLNPSYYLICKYSGYIAIPLSRPAA
jgi:hypothetical protein